MKKKKEQILAPKEWENSESWIERDNITIISQPELSDKWECYLFGGGPNDIKWTPTKGNEPNWFWRLMQYLILGNRWKRKENKRKESE